MRFSILPVIALSLITGGCGDPMMTPDRLERPWAVIAGSDFTSGGLSIASLKDQRTRINIDTLSPQSVIKIFENKVYVLNQKEGVIRIYDPGNDWRDPVEFATKHPQLEAVKSNPHDLYIDAPRRRALVTLYGALKTTAVDRSHAFGVINLDNPSAGITSFIPLTTAAGDTDNNPDADQIVACGGRLYVTLQDLDRNNMYKPVGPGRLAILDLAGSGPFEYMQLGGLNPIALRVIGGDCTKAVVAHADDQLTGVLGDMGGIELVDLTGRRSLGISLSSKTLGGNVSALDARDMQHVFIALSRVVGMTYTNDVIVVDAVAKTKGNAVLSSLAFVPSILVDSERLLIASAGVPAVGQMPVGLYVGTSSGQPISSPPLAVGLPPLSLAVYP